MRNERCQGVFAAWAFSFVECYSMLEFPLPFPPPLSQMGLFLPFPVFALYTVLGDCVHLLGFPLERGGEPGLLSVRGRKLCMMLNEEAGQEERHGKRIKNEGEDEDVMKTYLVIDLT